MRIIVIAFTIIILWSGYFYASELTDIQSNTAVAVDSVSIYYDGDLQVQFTYCHKGLFSTFAYSLTSGELATLSNIDFISPVKADIPKRESRRITLPSEWKRHKKLPIVFSIFFTLYNGDSFESAEIVGKHTYTDTIAVTLSQ